MHANSSILPRVGGADERLFWKLRHYRHHELLPPESDTQHSLRKRRHNLTLPEKKGHLAAKILSD